MNDGSMGCVPSTHAVSLHERKEAAAIPTPASPIPKDLHPPASECPNILMDLLQALPSSGSQSQDQCGRPADDADRVQAVRALHQIGTPPNARLDAITALMQSVYQVPVCMVTLIDEELVYVRSHSGPAAEAGPRPFSFCNWTLEPPHPQILVVEDATKDARFCSNPYVDCEPGVRFYAGCPLVGSCGHRYGTLCLVDFAPRAFAAEQYMMLCQFGELAVRELERDKAVKSHHLELLSQSKATATHRRILRALDALEEAVAMVDVSALDWPVSYANDAFATSTGVPAGVPDSQQATIAFWQLYGGRAVDVSQLAEALDAVRDRRPFSLAVWSALEVGAVLHMRFKPAGKDAQLGQLRMPLVSVPAGLTLDGQGSANCRDMGQAPALARWPGTPAELSSTKTAALAAALEALTGGPPATSCMASIDSAASAVAAFTEVTANREALEDTEPVYYVVVIDKEGPAAPASASDSHGLLIHAGVLPTKGVTAWDSAASSLVDTSTVGRVSQQFTPRTSSVGSLLRGSNGGGLAVVAGRDVALGPLLGFGGMGRCYRALWRGARVAVKMLDLWEQEVKGGQGCAARDPGWDVFDSECSPMPASSYGTPKRTSLDGGTTVGPEVAALRGALGLAHPYLLPTYAVVEMSPQAGTGHDGTRSPCGCGCSCRSGSMSHAWMLQRFGDRGTLLAAVDKGVFRLPQHDGPDVVAALQTALEVARGMAFVHGNALLHGALHGNNVLLVGAAPTKGDARGWNALVADYGIPRAAIGGAQGSNGQSTRLSGVAAAHLPPEVLLGGELSPEADVFAFGVLLWEMCSSRRAWRWMKTAEVVQAVAVEGCQLPPPRDVPQELLAILNRCLDHDPSVRPNFEVISAELAAQLTALGVPSEEP